jgi:hypothetical protein
MALKERDAIANCKLSGMARCPEIAPRCPTTKGKVGHKRKPHELTFVSRQYLAVGITMNGDNEVLGLWLA